MSNINCGKPPRTPFTDVRDVTRYLRWEKTTIKLEGVRGNLTNVHCTNVLFVTKLSNDFEL